MKNILYQLERKLGRNYIRDLMKYLTLAMLGVFLLEMLTIGFPIRSATDFLYFNRDLILKGQVWRAITYMILPPQANLLLILISLYFYYFLGTALERSWGGARFNIYYIIGFLCTLAAGFICGWTTNQYLNYSLLLCFAMMYPNQEFMLFFVLPVKVKWIGYLDAALMIFTLIVGSWTEKVVLLFSMIPFFLFFGRQLWMEAKLAFRRLQYKINQHR